ncbi:MAG TPA: hypothetical protein VGZ26_10375 [Pirellulales bacterium]|jgi:hypothetical protein|nr:hypothetical protein [Pirellulales bacterium]
MNDDLPDIFRRLTPRAAPEELRPRVLAAVSRELARRSTPRWERMFEQVVAASLLVAAGLACWRTRDEEQWQARVYGPPTVPSAIAEVAQAVASVTDEQTGRWVQERLSAALPSRRDYVKSRLETYQRILNELQTLPSS